MLRVHLYQLLYNAAYFADGSEFIEEPAPSLDASTTLGGLRAIPELKAFLAESRLSYLEHIDAKLKALVAWSAKRGARVVVFPEYSVPLEVLPALRRLSQETDLVIVAGSHRVRLTQSSREMYAAAGADLSKLVAGSAVSPVFLPDGKAHLVSKLARSKWEPDLQIPESGTEGISFESEGATLALGVILCIDALLPETLGQIWQHLKPNLILCPSLSPTTEPFRLTGGLMAANETVFGLANASAFGGTGFNVPDEWQIEVDGLVPGKRFLPSGLEAAFELDVEPGHFFQTRGSVRTIPPCSNPLPFPIIYEDRNPWISGYRELEGDVREFLTAGDPEAACEWIDGFLADQEPPLPDGVAERLKRARHKHIALFDGNTDAAVDALGLAGLPVGIEDTCHFAARRLSKAVALLTDLLRRPGDEYLDPIITRLRSLKRDQQKFGFANLTGADSPRTEESDGGGVAIRVINEARVAAFQGRGEKLNELKLVVDEGAQRVILVTGLLGVGKTELVNILFQKSLPDWTVIRIAVPAEGTVASVVSRIASAVGRTMDIDSIATASDKVFRQSVRRLFTELFAEQRKALIVDDLRDLHRGVRELHQLTALIDEASRPGAFSGSRLILISSGMLPSSLVRRNGIAHAHVGPLQERFVRRVLERQLRVSGLVTGESIPDVPEALLEIIGGNPLAARLTAEASRDTGLEVLAAKDSVRDLAGTLLDRLLPRVPLTERESQAARKLSAFRLPVEEATLTATDPLCDATVLHELGARGIVDFDGKGFAFHPVVRRFFYAQMDESDRTACHRIAAEYYRQLERKELTMGRKDPTVVAELAFHLALAGDIADLERLRALVVAELLPAARDLYRKRRGSRPPDYDRVLRLFLLIQEATPDDPAVCAWVGRCYGRLQQWTDSDAAFERAVKLQERARKPYWWIIRDWGHIRARFRHYDKARELLSRAKTSGGAMDPSILAGEAWLDWQTGDTDAAVRGFERVLGIELDHPYTLDTYSRLLDQLGNVTRAAELRATLARVEREDEIRYPREFDLDVEEEGEDED